MLDPQGAGVHQPLTQGQPRAVTGPGQRPAGLTRSCGVWVRSSQPSRVSSAVSERAYTPASGSRIQDWMWKVIPARRAVELSGRRLATRPAIQLGGNPKPTT